MPTVPIHALLVAAGAGLRAGGDLPKQYRRIGGLAVIARAADALLEYPGIAGVTAVIGGDQLVLAQRALGERPVALVTGGAERAFSVANGLAALGTLPDDAIVLIHDAARPFLPSAVIDRLVAALETADGAVPVLPVVDTIARDDGRLGDVVPRDGLARVQTPQAFRLGAIRAAHERWPGSAATDDAQVARAAGLNVATVAGDVSLEKLTVDADFARAETALASRMVSRTGMGFDVHAFCPGDHVWLGGLSIAHDHGLAGHSDADVVLHALVDAILGAIGAGDIGQHFPPSDPQWKGAASSRFAEHARGLVDAKGGVIDHVDVTVICERPKVGPYRDAIRTNVATVLRLPVARVSIKATTTEMLGFTGRGEGMAAQAVATVRLPPDED